MKSTLRCAALMAATATALLLTCNSRAASLGINFVESNSGGVQNGAGDALGTGEQAGAPGFQQVNWNNFGRWGATVTANDSVGSASGVTFTWDANNVWYSGAGVSTPNHKLMHGYLDSTRQQNWDVANPGTLGSFWWNENKPEVFVKNLSAWMSTAGVTNYTVVIYMDSDSTDSDISEYWLQSPNDANDPPTLVGADLTSHVFASDSGTFSGTFTQVPLSASSSNSAVAGNFIVFSNLTANEFILRTEDTHASWAPAVLSGFQIIPDHLVPVVDVQPSVSPTTVYVGQTFTLSVTAAGRPTLAYQWRKGGTDIGGATNTTYVKTGAVVGDAADYDVIISNSFGSVTSAIVSVAINSDVAPFNAVVTPAAVTRVTGSSQTFTVTADGTVPFTYQWRKDGSPIAGQTNATLALSNLTLADDADYTCSVSNYLGGTLSSIGALTMQTATGGSVGLNFSEGEAVNDTAFGVAAGDWAALVGANGTDQAVGALSVTWTSPNTWRQGSPSPAGDAEVFYAYLDDGSENTVVISNLNAVFATYVVRTLGSTDNGSGIQNVTITNGPVVLTYPNPVPNGGGGVTAISTVSPELSFDRIRLRGGAHVGSTRGCLAGVVITDKPVLMGQPQSPVGTIYVGGSFTIAGLDVIGVPSLAYQWRKNGANISGANSATYTKSGATLGDADNYDVIVTNAFGSVTSAVVAVTISDAAAFNIAVSPLVRLGYIGASATFTATAEGSQPFTYQWFKNNSPLSGQTNAALTLLNLVTNDAGNYSCTVSNTLGGGVSAAATLTVLPLPGGYAGAVIADEPLAYYRLNQPARAINSGSGGAAGDGLYFAGVTRSHSGALAGDADASAGFTLAQAQPVLIPNRPELNSGVFTVEAWVKPTIEGLANAASPLMNRVSNDGASGRQGWVFFQRAAIGQTPPDGNGSGFNFRMYQAGTTATIINITGGGYNTNEWTHLAATFDGTTARLYVNGAEAANGVASGTYAPNVLQGLGIGAWTELDTGTIYQNPFEGQVDEVAVYTNVLSAADLLAHYENGTNAARSVPYASLVIATNGATGYYRLNEPDAINSGTLGSSADGHFGNVADAAGAGTPDFLGLEVDNLAKGFNRTNSYIGLGNTSGLNITSQISLEAWVKFGTNQNAFANVVSHGVNATDTAEVVLRLMDASTPSGVYHIGSWDGSDDSGVTYLIPAADKVGTNWVHLVGTYDGANWHLYRNGTLVATAAGAFGAIPVNDANWSIGSSGNYPAFTQGFRGFNGAIDEVAIYDSALSAARVQAHYYTALYNTATPTPTLSISNSGGSVTVTWSLGTLLEAGEITGPWTTNNATSPYIVSPSAAKKFYRAQVP